MIDFQYRYSSPRLINLIAEIERGAGNWDRIGQNESIASKDLLLNTQEETLKAIISFETSNIPRERTLKELIKEPAPESLSAAYFNSVHKRVFETENRHRQRNVQFSLTDASGINRALFPATAPYVASNRFNELFPWFEEELKIGTYHPLVVLGCFHVALLQTLPFAQGTHTCALLFMDKVLEKLNYSFVRYEHPFTRFAQTRSKYIIALQQAERSAFDNWSTTSMWLEYFLQTMSEGLQVLLRNFEASTNELKLTAVQQKIMSTIKDHGPSTRELVARETGINLSTVKYNLGVLWRRGHLKRMGGGRTTSYILS